MAITHSYAASLSWSVHTAIGYRSYDRNHRVVVAPLSTDLTVTADPSFLGDPEHLNPEQLLLTAAASCQLLSFLALASRAELDVVSYEDDAQAFMPATRDRMRITSIVLRPRITLAGDFDRDEVERLVHRAHDECYIANTLACEMTIEPTFERYDD